MEASPVITTLLFFILTSALLLSALKTQRIPYTPATTIKRTVENTATTLGSHDSFSIGHGIVQVT